ncbi:hypothetical protein ACN4EG_11190 [Alkalinema pantanalense CENA528]|uniref:hypothetical protein n=1 Tax=Alkalinema pantanalense TaxID=1620705 RepID=UPI003D6DA9DA
MTQCPCCSTSLLRYVKRGQVEWFCPHCWQTMPQWPNPASISTSIADVVETPRATSIRPVKPSLSER